MEWNEHSIARLKALWESGATMSQIANQLGTTKNAISGKTHRLGLVSRPSPIKPAGVPKPRPLGEQRSAANARALLPMVFDSGVACLVPVGREKAIRAYAVGRSQPCRFIHGDVRVPGWRYCDAGGVPGKSYCAVHLAICTVSVRDRREDAA